MNRRLYLLLQSLAWRSQQAPTPVIQNTDPSGSDQPATEGAMTYTRKNVYSLPQALPGEWPDWFTWYARGIKALQALPLKDKLSWRYFGAIHGFDADTWTDVGQMKLGERLPPQLEMDTYWNQCQHLTWYFLPWHRGYLIAMEDALRTAIIGLGGPKDWSLCYWNYNRTGENRIPDPFLAKDMPNGEGPNPLYVDGRTRNTINRSQVNLDCLTQWFFTDGFFWTGFGGPKTGFSWFGNSPGSLESNPHNVVHGQVGGLMGVVVTAALDPIFWLHHANIDRLWATWVQSGGKNPTANDWLNGPIPSPNGRTFVIPRPLNPAWTFTPSEMANLSALDYTYESLAPLGGSDAETEALAATDSIQSFSVPSIARPSGEAAMSSATPELVGVNDGPLLVVGYETDTTVEIDNSARPKLAAMKAPATATPAGAPGTGPRLGMKLENVTGNFGEVTLSVFITPPGITDTSGASDLQVGTIGLFGLPEASDPDGPHGGQGITYVLELTNVIAGQGWQGEDVEVRIVSLTPVPDWANITIGKISIYYQAG